MDVDEGLAGEPERVGGSEEHAVPDVRRRLALRLRRELLWRADQVVQVRVIVRVVLEPDSQYSAELGSGPSWASTALPAIAIVWPPTKNVPACGALMVTTGGVPTVIGSDTVSMPGSGRVRHSPSGRRVGAQGANWWVRAGSVEIAPVPEVPRQRQRVAVGIDGPGAENWTVSGAAPCDGVAVAWATGGWLLPIDVMRWIVP